MYLAEIHGKISSKMKKQEDVLTSNVFSFFKYSDRQKFLKPFLNQSLGLDVSDRDAKTAKFEFWPRFEDNTEPDLVIIVGGYYLLFEAKFHAGFGEETKVAKAQLMREIEGGLLEAKSYRKAFKLITVMKDHYFKIAKPNEIPQKYKRYHFPIKWQEIAFFLYEILQSNKNLTKQDRIFAADLCLLLDRKNLRNFQGLRYLGDREPVQFTNNRVFFGAETAKFRGDFIGFLASLANTGKIELTKTVFLNDKK